MEQRHSFQQAMLEQLDIYIPKKKKKKVLHRPYTFQKLAQNGSQI